MTTISEAGRLYLKDADVLEEARNNVVAYFDAVRSGVRAAAGFAGKDLTFAGLAWKEYEYRHDGGSYAEYWAPPCPFVVAVWDPFAEERSSFSVWLKSTKKDKVRFERSGILPELEAAATVRGLKFSFEDYEGLTVERVELLHDDADELARRIAEAAKRMMQLASALFEVARSALAEGAESP